MLIKKMSKKATYASCHVDVNKDIGLKTVEAHTIFGSYFVIDPNWV